MKVNGKSYFYGEMFTKDFGGGIDDEQIGLVFISI